ncbi:MAG: outer membrane beta-barrel protein [Pseudomonadota bacterium]
MSKITKISFLGMAAVAVCASSSIAFAASYSNSGNSASASASMSSSSSSMSASQGQDRGIYIGVEGGGAYLQSQLANNLRYKFRWNVGGALGYKWDNHWRSDVTVTYMNNKPKELKNTPSGTFSFNNSSSTHAIAYIGSTYYDIDIPNTAFKIYPGVGVGAVTVMSKYVGNATNSTPAFNQKKTSTNYAFEFTIGTSYLISENINLYAQVRHIMAPNITIANGGTISTITGLNTVKEKYQNNLINVGLNYVFNM